MRKLLALVVIVVVVVAAVAIADVVVRHRVQSVIAERIDQRVPGAHATVGISSFPFLGHLAASGDVPKVNAYVTGVDAGPIALSSVDVAVHDLTLDKGDLFDGTVRVRSIRQVDVTATITEATLDAQIGLPVTIGDGTLGLAGIQAPATLTVTGQRVEIQVPPLAPIALDVPITSLLPCLGGAHLTPGLLTVTCSTSTIPPVLDGLTGSL